MPRSLADGKRRISIGTTAPAAGFLSMTPGTVDEADAALLASGRILTSDYNLLPQASDEIDEKDFEASGNAKGIGNRNFAGGFSIFRYFDSNGISEAAYEQANDLLVAAANAGTLVYTWERMTSKASTAAYATSDEITIVESLVDVPVTPVETSGYIKRRFELKPQRWTLPGATLAAGSGSAVPLISSALPTAVAEDGIVTITGARFTGTTDVDFGATPATSFAVISDNLLVATMPAGAAGAANIVVTNAAGASDAFAYTRGA